LTISRKIRSFVFLRRNTKMENISPEERTLECCLTQFDLFLLATCLLPNTKEKRKVFPAFRLMEIHLRRHNPYRIIYIIMFSFNSIGYGVNNGLTSKTSQYRYRIDLNLLQFEFEMWRVLLNIFIVYFFL